MTMPYPNHLQPHRDPLPLIIIGAGGHAKVLLAILKMRGRRVLCITDDSYKTHGTLIDGVPICGDQDEILKHAPGRVELVNGIGSVDRPFARKQIYQRFSYRAYRFATVIHPEAVIAHSAHLAQGVQVMAGAIVQDGAIIGANTILNTRCTVDHNCTIGAHSHIAPGATLSGGVELGQTSHIGTGASLIQGLSVGHEALIGAGAVVVSDVPTGAAVCGVPAKEM